MKRALTAIVAQTILLPAAFAQQTHLGIAIPSRVSSGFFGPVKKVVTEYSYDMSEHKFKEAHLYDEAGNLTSRTKWDSKGETTYFATNTFDEAGCFINQRVEDVRGKTTNDYEIVLNIPARKIAYRCKITGELEILEYNEAGHKISAKIKKKSQKTTPLSSYKRGTDNKKLLYTRYNEKGYVKYTTAYDWNDRQLISRSLETNREKDRKSLNVYDYLNIDEQGNWIQCLMRCLDMKNNKEKKFEKFSKRTIEYFGNEEPVEDGTPATISTNTTTEDSFPESSNEVSTVESTNVTTVATPTTDDPEVEEHAASEEELGAIQEGFKTGFSYTFDDISEKLVIVAGKSAAGRSVGSGFVAKMDGKTYIFTNQHIILGTGQISFTTASGEKLLPRKIELSTTRDITRLLLPDGTEGFGISSDIPMDAPIGVFGSNNSDEAAKELYGKVTGVGAEIVEVSADFASENSGSPVLNLNQEVVGIASHIRTSGDYAGKAGTRFENKTRHFCYRLGGVHWKAVDWKRYNEKYGNPYLRNRMFTDGIIELFTNWGDTPMERVSIKENPEKSLISWSKSHNETIGKHRSGPKKRFASEYSKSLKKLSESCSSRAQTIRMYSEQRELTGFLREEFDSQASTLDYAAKVLVRISRNAQDYR